MLHINLSERAPDGQNADLQSLISLSGREAALSILCEAIAFSVRVWASHQMLFQMLLLCPR